MHSKAQTLVAYNKQWGTKYKASDIVPISRLNWENREYCKYCKGYYEHTWQEHDIELSKAGISSPVKGEQPGMLGVPGKVHTQKRAFRPGQMEFESYRKYQEAKEQTTVPEEMKLLPNAKQNLYWWTVEQLRDECIRQGLIEPTKRYHKKALIDLLEPGLGLRPPYARKIGQVWDPEKHIWIDA